MILDKCIFLCNHHVSRISRGSTQLSNLNFFVNVDSFSQMSYNGITQHVLTSVWLVWLSVMSLQLVYVVAGFNIYSFISE